MTQEELEELVKKIMNSKNPPTIAEFWKFFSEYNINAEAEMWQLIEMKRAFYCGAMAWLQMQGILSDSGKDVETQRALWKACVDELREFAAGDLEMCRRDAGGSTIM